MRRYALIAAFLLLAGCDSLEMPSWLGGNDDKPKLPGERIAVLIDASTLKPDDTLKDVPMALPQALPNDAWPQAMGNAASHLEHLAFSAAPKQDKSVKIGEGNPWVEKFFTAPIIAGQKLFAMDAKGYISAHSADDISHVLWVSKAAVEKDETNILGGGLAFDNNTLFVVTGLGHVTALSPDDGHMIWQQTIGVPIRVAPKAANGKLLVLTVDSQTYALSEDKGETLWTHHGISETAGYISDVSPSIQDTTAVIPYSSGAITALDLDSGKELWTDTLILARRTAASAIFAGIGGTPVIADDSVYAVSNNGLLVATSLATGRRIWEQEISSNQTPWVAGDYLFVLSTGNALTAINEDDGRIKWVQQLPQYEDEHAKKNALFWRGPVLAGGKLWLTGQNGRMLVLDPATGVAGEPLDIPSDVIEAPIVVNNTMYLVAKDARLYSFK